jgi:hypothetical protein
MRFAASGKPRGLVRSAEISHGDDAFAHIVGDAVSDAIVRPGLAFERLGFVNSIPLVLAIDAQHLQGAALMGDRRWVRG